MKKANTFRTRIFLSLLAIALFQIVAVIFIIDLTGTTQKLDESTLQIYKNAVYNRGESIQEQLKEWSNIIPYCEAVNEMINEYAIQQEKTVPELLKNERMQDLILKQLSNVMSQCVENQGVEDCYIILEGNGEDKKHAIYLNCTQQQDMTASLTLVDVTGKDFYEKNATFKEGVYYTEEFLFGYSQPLLDQDGIFYGVMGIDVALERLNPLLPTEELNIDPDAAYYLGSTEDARTFHTIYVKGDRYEELFPIGDSFTVGEQVSGGINRNYFNDTKKRFDFYYYPLSLYNSSSPFLQERWVLGAFVQYDKLHASSRRLGMALAVALSLSLMISLVIAYLIANSMAKPLLTLMNGLKTISPRQVKLPRTKIREVDELAREIERRNFESYKAGNKIADIIQLSNAKLGMWECQENNELIFCTEKVFDIFRIPKTEWKDNYIPRAFFEDMLKTIMSRAKPVEDEKDVYHYIDAKGKEKYIRLSEKRDEKSWLCLVSDVTTDVIEKNKIKHERDYDLLTNLYNRRAFVKVVQEIISSDSCENAVVSIWDLDNLKYVNDTFGHEMGDKYICQLADYFSRLADEHCVVARMSGDEFLLFMYNLPEEECVERLKEVHAAFCREKLYLPDGNLMSVSASAGISFYPRDAHKYKELIQYADFAMYEVKKSSKGGINTFNKEHYIRDNILVNGVGELNRILQEESVVYAFQPIISVRECRVFAYEALLHPVSDTIHNATELLRLAESQSKLGMIERMTWFHSIHSFFEKLPQGNDTKLFLNSIPNQCLKTAEFEELEAMYGEKLQRLVVEMTESTKIDEGSDEEKDKWCKRWRVPLALDDFGTGYSNNDILISREFRYVKLDMSLIQNIHLYPNAQDLVKKIIEYCHSNGKLVIAEGIEKREELNMLLSMDVDFLQGYLLAQPSYELSNPDLSILRQELENLDS